MLRAYVKGGKKFLSRLVECRLYMDGLCRKTDEYQHKHLCDRTSSFGEIYYIKRTGVAHPCVRERTGKRPFSIEKLRIIWTCISFCG